jgi:hypothetical protein
MELIFEWDENKANTNLQKHKVSFDEAKTIFNDPFLITFRMIFIRMKKKGLSVSAFQLIIEHCCLLSTPRRTNPKTKLSS